MKEGLSAMNAGKARSISDTLIPDSDTHFLDFSGGGGYTVKY